jgi:hypothetical protein
MNQTVLTLVSVLAIYGLSSLALSRPDAGVQDDPPDFQTSDVADASPSPPEDDETGAA